MIKPSRIKAIARKEAIQILRDPLSLVMAFLMPALLLFIFGYAITLDVNNLRLVVHDSDKTAQSRELVSSFSESGYFTLVDAVDGQAEVDELLDSGKAQAALVIPKDFSQDLKTRKSAGLQAIVDGSDSNTATIAMAYISAITELYSKKLGAKVSPRIEPRVRVWYNPELKSRNYIIPGLIAVIMMIIAALLTSLTVAREWERGTMEQLISTPVKKPELILGKLAPYFVIGLIDMASAILIAVFLFKVPLNGQPYLLLLLSSLFLFGGLSLGILISIVAKSQLVASQVAMVATFLPAFLLSGFLFAIANMPPPLRAITNIVPARYFVTVTKGIFLKGSPLRLLVTETLFLFVYAVIVFLLANRKFKKRI